MNQLHLRLKNCLQTILELEPGIIGSRINVFESDFIILKRYLAEVDKLSLKEEEVTRLENITARFLREIGKGGNWIQNCNTLQ